MRKTPSTREVWALIALVFACAVPVALFAATQEARITHAPSKGQAAGFILAGYVALVGIAGILTRISNRLFGNPGWFRILAAVVGVFVLVAMTMNAHKPGLGWLVVYIAAFTVWCLYDVLRWTERLA